VFLEGDHIRKPLDAGLADHRFWDWRARPYWIGLGAPPTRSKAAETSAMNSSAQSWPLLVVPKRRRFEARHALQDAVRDARRCSSSFKISVRAVSQLID
jgi:hypothetical protein